MSTQQRNDRTSPVTQFCLAMEEARRTPAGRVRSARELVRHCFPRSGEVAIDRVFFYLPPEVRGPILSGWRIRGPKAALLDDDEKVRRVVADALDAGDIDDAAFEQGLSATTLIDWMPLPAWWAFWRGGTLSGAATQKALATARSLGLFDDAWFLDNISGRGGKLRGIDVICEALSREQLVGWLRAMREEVRDASAARFVAALGWDVILTRTSQEALLSVLDALARRIGLASTLTFAEDLEEIDSDLFFGDGDVDDAFDLVDAALRESGVHKVQPHAYRPVEPLIVHGRRTTPPPLPPRRVSGILPPHPLTIEPPAHLSSRSG